MLQRARDSLACCGLSQSSKNMSTQVSCACGLKVLSSIYPSFPCKSRVSWLLAVNGVRYSVLN